MMVYWPVFFLQKKKEKATRNPKMERKASSPVVRAEPEQQKLEAVEQPSHRPSPVRDLIPSKIEKQPKRHAPSTSLAKYA